MGGKLRSAPRSVLYDLRVSPPVSGQHVRAWRPPIPGVREVFHASTLDHAYPTHTHDTWTVFIVDRGAIAYHLDRDDHGAVDAMVSVLPPGVPHDGRPATSDGFSKRVLYVETSLLGEHLVGHAVDRPEIHDPELHRDVARLHERLVGDVDVLEVETLALDVADRIAARLTARPAMAPPPSSRGAERFRAMLDDDPTQRLTLTEAAGRIGANPTHLARSFTRTFGIPPHRYRLGRRIDAARTQLLDGTPPAVVAARLGFADQAHLTRRFRQLVGTTPARFAQ